MNCIKIITYYHDVMDTVKRNDSPASNVIVNYLSNCLYEIAEKIEIISPSWIIEDKCGYTPSCSVPLSSRITVRKAPSFGGHGLLAYYMKRALSRIWLVWYLIRNISHGEIIFVYHAPSLMSPIAMLSFIRKPNIVMLAEELYADIDRHKCKLTFDSEIKYLQKASAYIFPTELLKNVINITNKPYLVLYGAYNKNIMYRKRDNSSRVIHIVYAGTFDRYKGVFMAIKAARYLSENYHLHIIGYGTEKEISQIKSSIQEVSRLTSCIVSYDGFLSGKDYCDFIQKCDIGLCTQDPQASFTTTSFPSKILSYLSNGLKVVSVRIKTVENSAIAKCVCFYDDNKPFDVAKAIIKATNTDYDLSIIKTLDERFRVALSQLVKNLQD